MTDSIEEQIALLVEKTHEALDLISANADPAMQALAGQGANLMALAPVADDIETAADNIAAILAAPTHAATVQQAKTDAEMARDAAVAAAASVGGDPAEALARARFGIDNPTIQAPAKVFDFRAGFGVGDLDFTRATVGQYTDSRRVIVSAAAGETRMQHNPATGAPEGLAIAPARTRLNTHSVDLTTWNKSSVTVTANDGPSPDGGNDAVRAEDNHASAAAAFYRLTNIADDSAHYIASVYVLKNPGGPCCGMQTQIYGTGGDKVWIDLDPGTGDVHSDNGIVGVDCGVVDAGRWWRLWVRVQNNSTGLTQAYTHLYPSTKPSGGVSGGLDSTLTGANHFWGAMFEKSDVLAPVIMGNEGSQVTTDGDIASIDLAAADWFSDVSGEGTFLFAVALDWVAVNSGFVYLRTGTGKYANCRNCVGGDFIETLSGRRRSPDDADFRFSGTVWAGDHGRVLKPMAAHRIAIGWDQSGFRVSLDGEAPAEMPWSVAPEPFTEILLGNSGATPTTLGRFGQIAYWPRMLPAGDMQTLTGG